MTSDEMTRTPEQEEMVKLFDELEDITKRLDKAGFLLYVETKQEKWMREGRQHYERVEARYVMPLSWR